MNILTLLLLGISSLLPVPVSPENVQTGWLSQYDQSPTDGTIEYRQSVMQLPRDLSYLDGLIAVPDCDRMSETAWLSINDQPWLHVAVFDCSGHESTTAWMQENNIIGEASYYLAQEQGFLGQGGVEAVLVFPE